MPPRRIVLGVTSDISLTLMRGFPEYLARQGWDVHVVSSPGPLLDALSGRGGVTTHALSMEREPSPIADVRALLAWRRLLRRLRPDVTSVGTPKAGLLGGLAARWTGVPNRFYQLRGLRMETTRGLRRQVLGFTERLAAGSAHRVLAVSPSLRDRVVDLRLVDHGKVGVVGRGSSNGVDLARFSADRFPPEEIVALGRDLGLRDDLPIIGYVGRLTVDKGLAVLSDAVRVLEERGLRFQMLVVGALDGGRQSLGPDGSDVGTTVVMTGHVDDTAPYYQLMTVLCLPTFREGFPNVVLEAAAAGVPAVTTNATGAVDSVIDGRTGLIVPVGSGEALADALEAVLTDPERRAVLGASARAHVERSYSNEEVWSAYESTYAQPALRPAPEAGRR